MTHTVKRVGIKREIKRGQWIGYVDNAGNRKRAIVVNVTNGNVLHLHNGTVISAYSATKRG